MIGNLAHGGRLDNVWQHPDKFVAPLPGQRILLPHAMPHPFGHLLHQLVANPLAQGIIDGLEMVKVQKQNADVLPFTLGVVQCLGQAIQQQGAIG